VQPEQDHGGGDADRQRGPRGQARSPTVAIEAENRSASAVGPKNWSASATKVR
jgi:hypothetical protein